MFGTRLATALASAPGVDLVIAGRDLAKATALEESLGGRAIRFDRTDPVQGIAAERPCLVIDEAGPFQPDAGGSYSVARAALKAGAHYIDLSDDAAFTAGIAALDPEAKAQGLACLSGVSSVPALSAAAVRALMPGLADIHLIDSVILPGNRAPRGLSVIAAILAQAGRPVPVWRGGALAPQAGWSHPRRIDIGHGPRWASPIGAPDLILSPKAFCARSVRFAAGLELSAMHLGLWALALPVRAGLFRSLVPLAGPLRRAADLLRPFGTDRDGMRVRVLGVTKDGRAEERTWTLRAEAGDGPEVPAIPARVMVQALRDGRIAPGARACLDLDLAAAEAKMAGHRLTTNRQTAPFPLFFEAAVPLGSLPPALRALHQVIDLCHWQGKARIDRGEGRLARLDARLMRFPPAGVDVPVTGMIDRQDETELWTRRFGAHQFRSRLSRPRRGTGLVERFGPFSFRIGLQVEEGALRYPVNEGWFLGLPLPRAMLPVSKTVEAVDTDGRATFDVGMSHPLTGPIVRYRGWLTEAYSRK